MQQTAHQPLTMEGALSAFLSALEGKNRSDATRQAYHTDLMQFFIWVKENNLAATSPDRIAKADITEYLACCARRGLCGVSRARKLAAVRGYFRYLEQHDLIVKSPASTVETPRKERTERTHLHPEEYNRLLSLAGANPRDYAIFQVFLQTGLRVSELCHLAVNDVDVVNRVLHVRRGKGMTDRSIELEKKAIQAIKNYLTVRPARWSDRLFLSKEGAPMGERGVRKLVAKYRHLAGITKKTSPHNLRHTFATEKARKGVSPYQLQSWLGHRSLDTTQIYIHLARQSAHKVMEESSL